MIQFLSKNENPIGSFIEQFMDVKFVEHIQYCPTSQENLYAQLALVMHVRLPTALTIRCASERWQLVMTLRIVSQYPGGSQSNTRQTQQ